jgi:hypothetical protein
MRSYNLPAPTAATLMRLSARTGQPVSDVVSRCITIYLEVFAATKADGGLAAWLDRVYQATHDPAPRFRMRLQLPVWQQAALMATADEDETTEAVVLAAILGRTLAAFEHAEAAVGLPRGWGEVVSGLLAEHCQAA